MSAASCSCLSKVHLLNLHKGHKNICLHRHAAARLDIGLVATVNDGCITERRRWPRPSDIFDEWLNSCSSSQCRSQAVRGRRSLGKLSGSYSSMGDMLHFHQVSKNILAALLDLGVWGRLDWMPATLRAFDLHLSYIGRDIFKMKVLMQLISGLKMNYLIKIDSHHYLSYHNF